MRAVIISLFAFCILHSVCARYSTTPESRYINIQAPDGRVYMIDRLAQPRSTKVHRKDVSFHLFTRLSDSTGTHIALADFSGNLVGTNFNSTLPTYFFIHGWTTGHRDHLAIPHHILNLEYGKAANVFLVDYKPISGLFYTYAVGGLPTVGAIVAEGIHKISTTNGIPIEEITVIGFSLGAHVAGFAGAILNGKLKTIIGLDPAGPLFDTAANDKKLDASDAQYVQVIHANGGLAGHRGSLGHADFHPNGGGMNQPGCGSDLFGGCAHDRALAFFHESIRSNRFVATKCSSYTNYLNGQCLGNEVAVMGGLTPNTRVYGDYYLRTASVTPYALGA